MLNKILRVVEKYKIPVIIGVVLFFVVLKIINKPETEQLSPPEFSITTYEVYEETELYLSSKEEADIHYEVIDLTNPPLKTPELNLLSKKFDPKKPILLEMNKEYEIKAFAAKKGYADSEAVVKKFKVQKKLNTPTITVYNNDTVAISAEFGADIYYTIDGSIPEPEKESTFKYTGRFELEETTTINTIAVKNNYYPSDIATKTVEIAKVMEEVKEEKPVEIKPVEKVSYYRIVTDVKGKGQVINLENNLGETIRIEAVPEEGWKFVGWAGDIEGIERIKHISLVNTTGDRSTKRIIAQFEKVELVNEYELENNVKPVKIIKDNNRKVVLGRQNNYLYLALYNGENEIINSRRLDINYSPADIINTEKEYIILANQKKPYLIFINKTNFDYSIVETPLGNTEGEAIALYKGNYLIAGTYHKEGFRKIKLALLSKEGSLLWEKEIYNKEVEKPFDKANDIAIDGIGNIFLIGNTIGTINNDIILSGLNSEKIAFENIIGSRNNDYGINVELYKNDILIAAESNNIYPENKSDQKGYNIILERRSAKDGNLIKRIVIGDKDNNYPVELKVKDNTVYLLGNRSKDILIARIEDDLNNVKQKTLQGKNAISFIVNEDSLDILTNNSIINVSLSFLQ